VEPLYFGFQKQKLKDRLIRRASKLDSALWKVFKWSRRAPRCGDKNVKSAIIGKHGAIHKEIVEGIAISWPKFRCPNRTKKGSAEKGCPTRCFCSTIPFSKALWIPQPSQISMVMNSSG
jgi:hypothetical protein